MINKRRLLGISLAGRSTRRWFVVGYWAIVLSLVGIESQLRPGAPFPSDKSWWVYLAIFSSVGILGGTDKNGAVRRFDCPTPDEQTKADYTFMTVEDIAERKRVEKEKQLDERDTMLRNAMHYRAYAIIRRGAFLAAVVVWVLGASQSAQSVHIRNFLLWFVFVIFMSLPQSLILWTEPDMEGAQ